MAGERNPLPIGCQWRPLRRWIRSLRPLTRTFSVEVLGADSKQNIVTALRSILAGEGRDRLPDRPTRSRQFQRRLDDQEQAQLLAAYEQGARVNDLAEIFGVSRSAVIANVSRLGAESRRGIVHRRIDEACAL